MLHDHQQDDLPAFGKIDDIIVITGTPLLSIRLFNTIRINNHLLCYVIQHAYRSSLVTLSHLKYPEPLAAHSSIGDSNLYIALRSHVPNTAQ